MTVKMRTRNKSLAEPKSTVYQSVLYSLDSSAPTYQQWGTASTVTSTTSAVAGISGNKQCIDWVRSDYKSRIKSGEIINNPCTITTQKIENSVCYREAGYWKYSPVCTFSSNNPNYVPPNDVPLYQKGLIYSGTRPSSVYLGDPASPNTWTLQMPTLSNEQDLIDEVVTEAYSKIDTSDVSALVSIGEARETIKFLADSALRLIKLYKAVRSLNFKAIRSNMSISDFGKRYLEYRYAINPLVREMDDYFQATFIKRSWPVRNTFRAYRVGSIINDIANPYVCFNSSTYGTLTAKEYATLEYIIRAGVLCAIDLEKVDRYGLTNLATSALDLVPLSFIADWFFNISQTLAAHLPHAGTKQLASWYTISKAEVRTKQVIASTTPSSATVSFVTYDNVINDLRNCFISNVKETYQRVADPELRLFPQFKVHLDGWKLLDLGLIIKQLAYTPSKQTFVKRRRLATIEVDNKTLVW